MRNPIKDFWNWYTDLSDMGIGCLVRVAVTGIILLTLIIIVLSKIINR